mmetsp:Transcript_18718/g.39043  ORF Transcript_18718/g.39043 Transcript_18718/m.39043 type:complete len:85 (+) Transcript_18718:2061-2315(+)
MHHDRPARKRPVDKGGSGGPPAGLFPVAAVRQWNVATSEPNLNRIESTGTATATATATGWNLNYNTIESVTGSGLAWPGGIELN